MNWSEKASNGTKKNCENPIHLTGKYIINWNNYSKIDNTNTGTFMYLINKITQKKN